MHTRFESSTPVVWVAKAASGGFVRLVELPKTQIGTRSALVSRWWAWSEQKFSPTPAPCGRFAAGLAPTQLSENFR